VSHNNLIKWYKGNRNSWTVQASHTHNHASCFINEYGGSVPSDVDVTVGSASEEFMAELEKTVVEMNNQYEEDKDYQRMLRGTAVTYPGDIILFGRENPDIVPSVWQNEDGVFIAEAEGQSQK